MLFSRSVNIFKNTIFNIFINFFIILRLLFIFLFDTFEAFIIILIIFVTFFKFSTPYLKYISNFPKSLTIFTGTITQSLFKRYEQFLLEQIFFLLFVIFIFFLSSLILTMCKCLKKAIIRFALATIFLILSLKNTTINIIFSSRKNQSKYFQKLLTNNHRISLHRHHPKKHDNTYNYPKSPNIHTNFFPR